MRRLITVIFALLIIIGLSIFLWIKGKNDLVNRQTLIPRFNTSELPSVVVNEPYEADIFASIVGAKAEMQISAINIPASLSISKCNQNYNYPDIPKPNTVINCKLVGTLNEVGQIPVSFKVGAAGYNNSVIQEYELNIVQ